MTTGIDYAWSHPKPASIVAAGHTFVCRYLSKDPTKNLDATEAKALLAAGLDIVVVWETTANRAKGGPAAGAADGDEAKRQAEAAGAPATSAIYFAVDYDAQPVDYPAIANYAQAFGARVAPHPVGVYGSYAVCGEMLRRGVRYAWQTVAWSHGKRLSTAHLYQRLGQVQIDGVTCDVNETVQADYGGWLGTNAPAPLPPPAVTYHSEDDVALTILNVSVPTDLKGNGWLKLDVDPAKVLAVSPIGPDPSAKGLDGRQIGYPPMGDWGSAPHVGGGTVVTVIGGYPSGVAQCHVSVAG